MSDRKRIKMPRTSPAGQQAIEDFLMTYGKVKEQEILKYEQAIEQVQSWAVPKIKVCATVLSALKQMVTINHQMLCREDWFEDGGGI